jgi:hypothetical protein
MDSSIKAGRKLMGIINSLVVPNTSISAVASSPLVALISRLASPDNTKYDEKAKDPRQQIDKPARTCEIFSVKEEQT